MQGLADGYFILPYTMPNYIASNSLEKVDTSHPAFAAVKGRSQPARRQAAQHSRQAHRRFLPQGTRQADVGELRHGAVGRRPARAIWRKFRNCARNSGTTSNIIGTGEEFNQSLEKAGRVADFLELAELMCLDALQRDRILRRPFPRGEPDAGRRSPARRRAFFLRVGMGMEGRRRPVGTSQGAARPSSTFTWPRGATSSP